ncbi:MAG: hypothetical protein ACI85E_001008 [Marinomonas primoryensis]|jgi:hypothetical protein
MSTIFDFLDGGMTFPYNLDQLTIAVIETLAWLDQYRK